MIRLCSILVILTLSSTSLFAQLGIEQYHYLGQSSGAAVVPVIHLQSKKGWYGEARYNYDEDNTFTFLAGKKFVFGSDFEIGLTPLAGISFGSFKGYTFGLNSSFENERFFISNQTQSTKSKSLEYSSFFFNWSEAGININKWFYAGLTMQNTRLYSGEYLNEPGIMFGINIKSVTIPFYAFNRYQTNRFYVLGIIWEKK